MKIAFENFKIFKDRQEFELKPITILTGTNNAGKSSLIKLLLLLRDAFKGDNYLPFLELNTKDYRLGSVEDTFNRDVKTNQLIINIYDEIDLSFYFEPFPDYKEKEYYKDKLECKRIIFDDKNIKLIIDFQLNKWIVELEFLNKENFIQDTDALSTINKSINEYNKIIKDLESKLNSYNHEKKQINKEDIETLNLLNQQIKDTKKEIDLLNKKISRLERYKIENIQKNIQKINFEISPWSEFFDKNIENKNLLNAKLDEVEQNIFLSYRTKYFEIIEKILKNFIYLSSLLHLRKRIISKDESTAKYIEKFLKLEVDNSLGYNTKKKKFTDILNKLSELDLNKEDIKFELVSGAAYKITIKGVNLYDYGDGFKNVFETFFPIILEDRQTVFIAEEPEIRLHPKNQSLLADIFVHLFKQDKHNFIIETHSEYLIRRLQYLVAKEYISPDDIGIFYLEQNGKIRRIEVNENGSLKDDFDSGFFDEASKQMIKLIKKQSGNE